jgi:hypothetical protein
MVFRDYVTNENIGTVEYFTSLTLYGRLLNEHTGRSRCSLHNVEVPKAGQSD